LQWSRNVRHDTLAFIWKPRDNRHQKLFITTHYNYNYTHARTTFSPLSSPSTTAHTDKTQTHAHPPTRPPTHCPLAHPSRTHPPVHPPAHPPTHPRGQQKHLAARALVPLTNQIIGVTLAPVLQVIICFLPPGDACSCVSNLIQRPPPPPPGGVQ